MFIYNKKMCNILLVLLNNTGTISFKKYDFF